MLFNIKVSLLVNGAFISDFIYASDEDDKPKSTFTLEEAIRFTQETLARPEFVQMMIVAAV